MKSPKFRFIRKNSNVEYKDTNENQMSNIS
jgi:hypothetical protein